MQWNSLSRRARYGFFRGKGRTLRKHLRPQGVELCASHELNQAFEQVAGVHSDLAVKRLIVLEKPAAPK